MQRRGGLDHDHGRKRGIQHHFRTDPRKSPPPHQAYWKECGAQKEHTPKMEHIARQKIHKNEHEKKVHKPNHHEQQDPIATPWQIWERAEEDEYIEPDCIKDTDNQEGAEEREEEQVWIDRGAAIKEQEIQAARPGKGTLVENGKDMMERAEETHKKRRIMTTANEEAIEEYKRELTRQEFRYCPNPEQSGNERYINAKYQGGPDLQVPIDNSSTTPGVFAANPFRPILNPYTHRPIYQNKRYLKQRKNKNKHRNKQNKFTYKQPHEQEQLQAPTRTKRSEGKEKQKGKRPINEAKDLTHDNTPTKKSKTISQTYSAEDHKKNNQENKRKRGTTKEPAVDKLFTAITNKVVTMLKYKGASARAVIGSRAPQPLGPGRPRIST
jgi:hypothetical protein